MTPERERIEREVHATASEGRTVRERALHELAELDRVLRHDPARADPQDGAADPPEGREVPWWRKLLL